MKKISSSLLVVIALAVFAGADMQVHHSTAPAKGSADFERIKDLAGVWTGSSKMHKKKEEATVIYQVTSGGQVVTETLFPGTTHEMISVYYEQGGKLAMTHYCMLPNRPTMEVKKSTAKQIDLEATAASVAPGDLHMHSLSLTWKGPDQLTHKWVTWQNGKPGESSVITLTRVK